MNADGTNQVNITNNPADDRDPDWCCQSCQSAGSTQLEKGPHTPLSLEGFPPWGLVILVSSLMMILIVFLCRTTMLRKK
jgi:hypothetical protein